MVFLDTDVIINFLRNDPKTIDLINQLIRKRHELKTTSVNSFELWKGVYRSKKKSAHHSVEAFLSWIKVMDFNDESSKEAAKIFESLKAKGELIDVLNVIISSIVITNKESLLTHNKKHFSRIKGLKLA